MIEFPVSIFSNSKEIIINNSTELDAFSKHFIIIKCSGGIVFNNSHEILMITKYGFPDFPKGSIEENETPEEAAKREIKEETGIQHLIFSHYIGTTFHTFVKDDKAILKYNYWYQFYTLSSDKPISQNAEGITNAEWFDIIKVEQNLKNSYPSLQNLWKKFKQRENSTH